VKERTILLESFKCGTKSIIESGVEWSNFYVWKEEKEQSGGKRNQKKGKWRKRAEEGGRPRRRRKNAVSQISGFIGRLSFNLKKQGMVSLGGRKALGKVKKDRIKPNRRVSADRVHIMGRGTNEGNAGQ